MHDGSRYATYYTYVLLEIRFEKPKYSRCRPFIHERAKSAINLSYESKCERLFPRIIRRVFILGFPFGRIFSLKYAKYGMFCWSKTNFGIRPGYLIPRCARRARARAHTSSRPNFLLHNPARKHPQSCAKAREVRRNKKRRSEMKKKKDI